MYICAYIGLGSVQFAKLQSVFSPSDSSSSSSTNNQSLSAGAIAGITIAVLVVVAAMIVGVLIIMSRRRGQTGSVNGSGTGNSVAFGSPWSSGKAKGSMKTPLITELTDEWKTTA